jgi:carboxymethylenebutenolidase
MANGDSEAVWTAHTDGEFVAQNVDATMDTMTDDPFVVHVPTAMGGRGRDGVRSFYAEYFVGHNPADFHIALISRTVGAEHIVDEMVVSFTHDVEMPWLLPGIAPTGRLVEIPVVAVVGVQDARIDSEHIYWDQASVLSQVGVLDIAALPALGADQSRVLVDPGAPLNTLAGGAGPR